MCAQRRKVKLTEIFMTEGLKRNSTRRCKPGGISKAMKHEAAEPEAMKQLSYEAGGMKQWSY